MADGYPMSSCYEREREKERLLMPWIVYQPLLSLNNILYPIVPYQLKSHHRHGGPGIPIPTLNRVKRNAFFNVSSTQKRAHRANSLNFIHTQTYVCVFVCTGIVSYRDF